VDKTVTVTLTKTMTVSFYLLTDETTNLESFACRLCQRALAEGLQLFVCCESIESMERFDQLLWTFQASSFIPHAIDDPQAPICLGLTIPDLFLQSTVQPLACLNLSHRAVDTEPFDRVFEIVAANDVAKATGRERFKAYKQQGITPTTHQIK
jgi:DNA polymerase III subunit chi